MQNFSEPAFRVKHPGLTMASLLLGAFVGMFSETSLNIALPKLMLVFHTSTAVLQWLVTGYMLVIGIVLPLSSLIAKWFTTRQIVIFACWILLSVRQFQHWRLTLRFYWRVE